MTTGSATRAIQSLVLCLSIGASVALHLQPVRAKPVPNKTTAIYPIITQIRSKIEDEVQVLQVFRAGDEQKRDSYFESITSCGEMLVSTTFEEQKASLSAGISESPYCECRRLTEASYKEHVGPCADTTSITNPTTCVMGRRNDRQREYFTLKNWTCSLAPMFQGEDEASCLTLATEGDPTMTFQDIPALGETCAFSSQLSSLRTSLDTRSDSSKWTSRAQVDDEASLSLTITEGIDTSVTGNLMPKIDGEIIPAIEAARDADLATLNASYAGISACDDAYAVKSASKAVTGQDYADYQSCRLSSDAAYTSVLGPVEVRTDTRVSECETVQKLRCGFDNYEVVTSAATRSAIATCEAGVTGLCNTMLRTNPPVPMLTPKATQGDPHTFFNGTMTDFHLPVDTFTNLFEQDGVAVMALGGPKEAFEHAGNFIHAVSLHVNGSEVVLIEQKSRHVREDKTSITATANGEQIPAGTEVPIGKGLAQVGKSAGRLIVRRSNVIVEVGDLLFTIRSMKSKSKDTSKAFPNHLDFHMLEGLDENKASGLLPELWGLRPRSKETKNLILKEVHDESFLSIENVGNAVIGQ